MLTKTLLFSLLLAFAWYPLPASVAPKDVVLVLDNSSSMKKNDPEFLTRLAVQKFFDQIGNESRVALLLFDQEVRLLMPLTPLDEVSRVNFLRSLNQVDYQGLYTYSPAAIERAIRELKVNGRPEADRSIVFMTDGVVDTGNQAMDITKSERLRDDLAAEAAEHGIRVFGIAFSDSANLLFIQSLSKRTSGEYFRAFSGADIEGVFQRITRILARLQAPASALGRPGKAPAFTPLPEPAPSPQLELPEAAPIFFDPPRDPGSAEAPDETATLPAHEVIATAETAVLPTLSKEEINYETSADSESMRQLAQAGEPAGNLTPAARSDAKRPVAPNGLETISTVVAKESERARVFVPSAWLAFLLAAGIAGVFLVSRKTFLTRRRTVEKTMLEDELPKAFLNDLGGITDKPSYELGESLTVVGRIGGSDADRINYVVIPEPTVGRRHALIEFKNHCFWVADQNSLNGTFINDQRIEGDTRLKHGDRIRFYKHEFEFLLLDMFETDRTTMSQTVVADFSRAADGDNRIQPPAPEDAGKAAFTAE